METDNNKIKGISLETINKMNHIASMNDFIDIATDTFIQSLDAIYDKIPEEDLKIMKNYYKQCLIKNIINNFNHVK
jgi:hypothetical protein